MVKGSPSSPPASLFERVLGDINIPSIRRPSHPKPRPKSAFHIHPHKIPPSKPSFLLRDKPAPAKLLSSKSLLDVFTAAKTADITVDKKEVEFWGFEHSSEKSDSREVGEKDGKSLKATLKSLFSLIKLP